jgi:hypothetical protein
MKSIVRAAFVAGLLSSATFALAPVAASAADTPKLTHEVQNDLAGAQKALQSNDYATALASVQKAQAVADRTPYDDYMINTFLAEIYIGQKDYANATAPMEAAADSTVIPDDQKKQTYFNAFQLAMNAKHYQKAATYGEQLIAINALDSNGYAMLAEAYYQTQDFPHAQQYAQKSIDLAKAAGQAPNQGALIIVYNSQIKQKNTGGASAALEDMAVNYNDAGDWSQLIDQSLGGKNVRDEDAFYLLRLKMLIPGAMRDDDYLSLASAADERGYATEAYSVLQKGISAGKITAGKAGPLYAHSKAGAASDAHDLAQIAASAEKSKTGQQDIKLAEDYWGYGRFADAEAAAHRAIGKGGLKTPTEGPLVLGMTLVAQGKYDQGIQTLAQSNSAAARLWTLYAKAQQKKAGATAQTPAPAH